MQSGTELSHVNDTSQLTLGSPYGTAVSDGEDDLAMIPQAMRGNFLNHCRVPALDFEAVGRGQECARGTL